MTAKIYYLNSFQDFTKVVFVVSNCSVVFAFNWLKLLINLSALFWELNILALILFV